MKSCRFGSQYGQIQSFFTCMFHVTGETINNPTFYNQAFTNFIKDCSAAEHGIAAV